MSYKNPLVSLEIKLYFHTALFTAGLLGLNYWYLLSLGATNPLNKAVADVSIILMGLSMVMSSVTYFWNTFDALAGYRKHWGLVGFWLAMAHVGLSFGAVQRLLQPTTWEKGVPWAPLTGLIALVIFAVMAAISNTLMARMLGRWWKPVLRFGYMAVALVWLHVYFLKAASIMKWYSDGMITWLPTSLLMLAFMTWVMVMRGLLWLSLKRKLR